MWYTFVVTNPMPLDRFLATKAGFAPEEVRDWVDFGAVWVDRHRETRAGHLLKTGQEVRVHIPRYGAKHYYEADPARVLLRDAWLLAYDKEAGIPCQSTPYDNYNNIYEGLRRCLHSGVFPGGPEKGKAGHAGSADVYLALHHRLDMHVSGVMLFALSGDANGALSMAFRDRSVEKVYRAVVCGEPARDDWVTRVPIGRKEGRYLCVAHGQGKDAETRFRVIRRMQGSALIEAIPRTGRTHQIRLHLSHEGLPVLGDRQYGGRACDRMMLHAFQLGFDHPMGKGRRLVEAPLPQGFL